MATKAKKSTQRKLTAILCADVVGYSRLMGDDEEATIETLTAYCKVFTAEIKKHRGVNQEIRKKEDAHGTDIQVCYEVIRADLTARMHTALAACGVRP